MEYKVKLLPPTMPAYISIERPARPRQEGISNPFSIRICELTNEQAEEYGELMKQTFLQHYKAHVEKERKATSNERQ